MFGLVWWVFRGVWVWGSMGWGLGLRFMVEGSRFMVGVWDLGLGFGV